MFKSEVSLTLFIVETKVAGQQKFVRREGHFGQVWVVVILLHHQFPLQEYLAHLKQGRGLCHPEL